MPGAETTIVIDLGETRDARAIADERQFVHQDALKRLRELLPPLIRSAAQPVNLGARGSGGRHADAEVTERRHDAIAVLGGRGSGKTTFLLSVLRALDAGTLGLVPEGCAVRSLNILDPTLVGTKECILLTIISRITSLVEAHNRRCGRAEDDAPRREAWERSLEKLARGLAVLDEIGTNPLKDDGWSDHNFVVETGLENVTASRLLERRFHDFLAASLDLIGASAFVIGIDDIDTAFDRGWPVLETLRRYLTSPKLIILLAGDLELFSALVRKTQWENLGDLPSRHEPDRTEYYTGLVDRLEDQYLMKLMKPENRIVLGSVYRQIGDGRGTVLVRYGNDDIHDVRRIMADFCATILCVQRNNDHGIFIRVLLSEPIRTVVQLLHICQRGREGASRDEMVDSLVHVFATPLSQLGLQPHRVRELKSDDFGPLIAQLLVEREIIDSAFFLWPGQGTSMINLGLIALGAKLSLMTAKKPNAALEYMLKVGLSRQVMIDLPWSRVAKQVYMTVYLRYTGLDGSESALGVARRAGVFLHMRPGQLDLSMTRLGTVALVGRVESIADPIFLMHGVRRRSRGRINLNKFLQCEFPKELYLSKFKDRNFPDSLGMFYNDFRSLFSAVSSPEFVGLISLATSSFRDESGQMLHLLSIFNIIAVATDILDCVTIEEVEDVLRRGAQSRLLPMPRLPDDRFDTTLPPDVSNKVRSGTLDGIRTGWKQASSPVVAPLLLAWAQKVREWKGRPLSAHATARMWSRFVETLQQLDDDIDEMQGRGRRVHAGEALHHMIIGFLNAVLVEAAVAEGIGGRFEFDSPSFDNFAFSYNIHALKIHGDDGSAFLFRILWACPLWIFYLDQQSGIFSEVYRNHIAGLFPQLREMDLGVPYLVNGVTVPNLHPLLNTLLVHRPPHLSVPHDPSEAVG